MDARLNFRLCSFFACMLLATLVLHARARMNLSGSLVAKTLKKQLSNVNFVAAGLTGCGMSGLFQGAGRLLLRNMKKIAVVNAIRELKLKVSRHEPGIWKKVHFN